MQPAPGTVRSVLRRTDFRRMLGTRLLSQCGDGVFQAALAGTVLFNPQRAAEPIDVAAGFAVLLLPYSLVGPFAGVWLDRWSRRQVLLRANVVRATLVAFVAALVERQVSSDGVRTAIGVVVGVIAVVVLVQWVLKPFVRWYTTTFTFTNSGGTAGTNIDLTDALALELGYRYTHDSKSYEINQFFIDRTGRPTTSS